MNAGAYGGELADVLISAEAVDRAGRSAPLTPSELGLSYRHSDGAGRLDLHLGAAARARPAISSAIARRIAEIDSARAETQPRSRTGGSTFANPPGHKAWELIDRAGCRGLRIGDAQVSEKHCNFLINLGAATAADIEALGEEVRRRVLEHSGVLLHWEIRRIGSSSGMTHGRGPDGRLVARARGLAGERQGLRRGPARGRPHGHRVRRQARPARAGRFPAAGRRRRARRRVQRPARQVRRGRLHPGRARDPRPCPTPIPACSPRRSPWTSRWRATSSPRSASASPRARWSSAARWRRAIRCRGPMS